jgi:hypothetical protein
MPDSADNFLSNDDIALLCDIGTFVLSESTEHGARLQRLIAAGFVERASAAQAPEKFQLTGKAMKVLTERGVGLNEA